MAAVSGVAAVVRAPAPAWGHVGTDGAERTRIVEAKLPCEPCADTSWGIVEACVWAE